MGEATDGELTEVGDAGGEEEVASDLRCDSDHV